MADQHLVLLRPARASFPGDATPEEQETVAAHFAHLSALRDSGICVLAGRTQVDTPLGIVVLDGVSESRAREILASDPAVAGGVFLGELLPFRIALERGPTAAGSR